MDISIKDFRCFHSVDDVPIKPINILVGENSSGKTTLLAAVRFMSDFINGTEDASFNKDPFFLGSYEQIAHYRGGRFGRAKEFSFELKGEITRFSQRHKRVHRNIAQSPRNYELCVCFVNDRSQPATSKIEFFCGDYSFKAGLDGDYINITINTPSRKNYEYTDRFMQAKTMDSFIVGTSYIDFVLRDLRFLTNEAIANEKSKEPDLFFDEVLLLSDLYTSAKRSLPRHVYASAPVRSKPERTYNPGESNPAPSGEHIPFVLARIKAFDKELWTDIAKTLSSFGKHSGLFEDVNIKRLSNTDGGPFQIIVRLSGTKSNIIDVGYGVSQSLPIITDLVRASDETTFLIQQPEVHLHPRAQAELATFFAQIVQRKKHTLFIETHSDYLIDRIRMEARDGKFVTPDDIAILFFEREGLDVKIHPIYLDKIGNIIGAPPNYREFFIHEEYRSLGVELK